MFGNSEETLLVNDTPRLAPGSTEVFSIKAGDVGGVSNIVVRLVGVEGGGWLALPLGLHGQGRTRVHAHTHTHTHTHTHQHLPPSPHLHG